MPELPEVQTVVNTLQPLVGQRLGTAQLLQPDILHGESVELGRFVRRRRIRSITRRAKRILIDIGNGRTLMFHLGMTGQLTVKRTAEQLLPHTHLVIKLAGSTEELRFRDVRRFGGVWLLTPETPQVGRGLGPLGPDPLEITLREFRTLMGGKRQVKALLLDQQRLAGMGNIYVDESLFRARIHPLAACSTLDDAQVKTLHRAIRTTLRAAIRAGGSTIRDYRTANGEKGWFQIRHQVYGREGEPCRDCRTPITRIQVAGRSSHVCPQCQSLT